MTQFLAPPEARPDDLDDLPWVFAGPVRRAAHARFSVRSTHPALGSHIDHLLEAFPPVDGDGSATRYSVVHGVGGWPQWLAVYAGHRRISNCSVASVALTHLLGHLNRRVVAAAHPCAATLHAAACAHDGRAVVISGPTESGKSTLAAGLALAGFEYLTDEVVIVDPNTFEITPYPKPLNIDPGSWPVLAELRPDAPPALPDIAETQWHVDPRLLPGGVAMESRPVGAFVRCRYVAGGRPRLQRMPAAAMVAALIRDGFRPRTGVPAQLRALGSIARNVPNFQLEFASLDQAVDAVNAALATADT